MNCAARSWANAAIACTLRLSAHSLTTDGNEATSLTSPRSWSFTSLSAHAAAASGPGRASALRSIEHARACAYCRNGALLPSKLSASSHLNTICFSACILAMLYLRAPKPTVLAMSRMRSSERSVLRLRTSSYALSTASSMRSSSVTTVPFLVDILPSGSDTNA